MRAVTSGHRLEWSTIERPGPSAGDAVVDREAGRVVGTVVEVAGERSDAPAQLRAHRWFTVELDAAYVASEAYVRHCPNLVVVPSPMPSEPTGTSAPGAWAS